ncbi:MAG: AAA family ATPase [Sphaerochaetaceae bacterium]|nr:AAA family ATPase [Sphaerochaetaceae bacterium]
MKLTLAEALEKTGLSLRDVGDLVGLSKSAISRIKNHSGYPNEANWERVIIKKMVDQGILPDDILEKEEKESAELKVDPAAFIPTQNVIAVNSLANGLLDPATTLNSSIGMVTGSAGYGKTTAIKHFVVENPQAVYILFMEGYSLTMLVRKIALELTGFSQRTFDRNLAIIKEATSIYRHLIIIDEADRIPLKILESLRNINEYCGSPILLVGEKNLIAKMESLPRLRSRVRKPEINFRPINTVDVATYYQIAVGLDISGSLDVCKTLLNWAAKDFRTLVNDAQHIVTTLNTTSVTELTNEVLNAYKPYR